jgi:hypothetical protein
VLDFARADTEREGAKGTVCGGVAVTADDGGTGEGEPLLGTDDVDDTLTPIFHAEICETEVLDILFEGGALQTGVGLFNELFDILEVFPRRGGDVLSQLVDSFIQGDDKKMRKAYVINCDEGAVRPADLAASVLETLECLRGRHLVDEMSVCDRLA